jgi:C-terminal processing protease CtpA/Prc
MTPSKTSYDNIRAKIADLIRNNLFHPEKDNAELAKLSEEFADLWPDWVTADEIESGVNGWLRKLKLSHTGFWRGPGRGLPAYFAINATLKRIDDGPFVFWDVLPGGLAERAGINPGDLLAGIDGKDSDGDEPRFQFGRAYTLNVLRNGVERMANISLPSNGPKDRPPMSQAKPLTYEVKDGIAVLKVTSFPGAVGFGLLRDLKNALAIFDDKRCDRLILDLRSNCGGGLSSVRLMSLLVPDCRLIGYSLTRLGRDRKKSASELPAIRRLPGSKLESLPLAIRFKLVNRDRSFRLFTEGLGPQRFHGRIALLVNEYTRSAAEMIAAFARNEGVAHVVGTTTPGEVLGAANFHVGSDYRLRIPVTAWYTAKDQLIEGRGVEPDTEQANTLQSLISGRDLPTETAHAVLKGA